MARSKIVIVSDVHMGSNNYSWLKDSIDIKGMLKAVASDSMVKELVMLGDIFDLWTFPVDERPYPIDSIIDLWDKSLRSKDGKETVIGALRECINNLEHVYYINGNHDMTVTSDLNAIIGNGSNRTLEWITDNDYNNINKQLLHIEHGHAVDTFNAPDDVSDPCNRYPVGYYISRIIKNVKPKEEDGWQAFYGQANKYANSHDMISDDKQCIRIVSLIIDIISGMATLKDNTKVDDNTTVLMPNQKDDISIGNVKMLYCKLIQRWYEHYNKDIVKLKRSMLVTVDPKNDGLYWYAKQLIKQGTAKVIVFGHTHQADEQLHKYHNNIYANSGSWCKIKSIDRTPRYVEVDIQPSKIIVSLMKWNRSSGTSEELHSKHLLY